MTPIKRGRIPCRVKTRGTVNFVNFAFANLLLCIAQIKQLIESRNRPLYLFVHATSYMRGNRT